MTALAEVDLYNLSLSHCGNGVEVQNPTENSAEARACLRYYGQTRDEILEEFPWPFAKKTVALALVETNPTTEWLYAYRYPVDCVRLGRLLNVTRVEVTDGRIPYRVGRDDEGILIYTDLVDAVIEYTSEVEDTTQFSPLFSQAVAWKLAFYIAPRVTGGDPHKLGDRAFQFYQQTVERAKDLAANEEQPDPLPQSEFISARDG